MVDGQLLEAALFLHGEPERVLNPLYTVNRSNDPGWIHINCKIGSDTVGIVVLAIAIEITAVACVDIIQQYRSARSVYRPALPVHAAIGFPQQGVFLIVTCSRCQHLYHRD